MQYAKPRDKDYIEILKKESSLTEQFIFFSKIINNIICNTALTEIAKGKPKTGKFFTASIFKADIKNNEKLLSKLNKYINKYAELQPRSQKMISCSGCYLKAGFSGCFEVSRGYPSLSCTYKLIA
jgi:hypothetical protein